MKEIFPGFFNGRLTKRTGERRKDRKGQRKRRPAILKQEGTHTFLTFSSSSVKIPLRLSGPLREGAAVTGLAAVEVSYTQVNYHQILRMFYTPVQK
jgi:hypothetical protein